MAACFSGTNRKPTTRRAVQAAEALAWLKKNFGNVVPAWLPPVFPEKSPADELIYEASRPLREKNELKESRLKAWCEIELFLRMEISVASAVALLEIFSRARAEQLFGNREAVGYTTLADECGKELHDNWNAAHEEGRAFARGERATPGDAAVMLQFPVAKACGLLTMLGAELEANEIRSAERRQKLAGETKVHDRTGHIILARDCVRQLRADYDAAFAEWMVFEKSHEQRQAA